MRALLIAAFAAIASCVSLPAAADGSRAHFEAWDRYQSVQRTPQRRATRSARHTRVARSRSVRLARRAPAPRIAAAIVAPAVAVVSTAATVVDNTIAAVEQNLPTPFGTVIRTVANLAGVPGEIASFLNTVQSRCGGVRVISTFRRGSVIAGTRRASCHSMGQAVDYQVSDYACALRVAQGVRLGHSIDYVGVQRLYGRGMPMHYHVSNCRQEMGVRFAHGGGARYARRAARTRYAGGRGAHRARYAVARAGQRIRVAAVIRRR